MKPIFKKIFILTCLIQGISTIVLFSQVPSYDHISDTVKCRAALKQSYALYLPAQYDHNKKWPVILIFDPAAKGRTGVNAFVDAGRKYGFILACSNNSRNGAMGDNFTAAAAMLKDVEDRFSIDQRRIYTSGFSGGSRFAMAFALKEKKISGIIGCGAGLPNDQNNMPTANSDFLYYGLAGNRDMNYPEMNDLLTFFSNRTMVTSYLRTFSGGHQWPAPELTIEAVEWLVLQAMNRKLMPADSKFLSYIQNKTSNRINSSPDKIEAVMYMRFAVRDFQGTAFASGISKLLSNTEKSSDYQSSVVRWNRMFTTEQEKKGKYLTYLGQLLNAASLPDTASGWWTKEAKSLIRLRDKGNAEDSQLASRLMNFLSILCSEQGTAFYKNRLYSQAAFLFEICTYTDSENQNNYYNFSRSLAGEGKSKEALNALSGAINHGLTSRKTVEADPVFGMIRNEPKYKELINKMK